MVGQPPEVEKGSSNRDENDNEEEEEEKEDNEENDNEEIESSEHIERGAVLMTEKGAAGKKKVKYGEVGAPDSKKRKDFMAKIRADKRTTQKQKDDRIAELAKEDIKIIEAPVKDLELEEKEAHEEPPIKEKAVKDIEIKEKQKMEAPGVEIAPYVEYPY